jgi:hypothetical protein
LSYPFFASQAYYISTSLEKRKKNLKGAFYILIKKIPFFQLLLTTDFAAHCMSLFPWFLRATWQETWSNRVIYEIHWRRIHKHSDWILFHMNGLARIPWYHKVICKSNPFFSPKDPAKDSSMISPSISFHFLNNWSTYFNVGMFWPIDWSIYSNIRNFSWKWIFTHSFIEIGWIYK